MNRAFRTVLFDWDGTLCDSGAALYRAFEKSLAEFGVSFTRAEYTAVYTPAWYRMYEAFGLPKESWKLCDRRWLHHYQAKNPDLLPGAARRRRPLPRRRTAPRHRHRRQPRPHPPRVRPPRPGLRRRSSATRTWSTASRTPKASSRRSRS